MTQSASSVSAPIWNSFMKKAIASSPRKEFERPAGIKTVTLDATTGRLATDKTTKKRTDIFPSWYKPAAASTTEINIDKVSGKLATECTPPLAIQASGGGSVLPEIPTTDISYGRWNAAVTAGLGFGYGSSTGGSTGEKDDVHKCDDAKPRATLEISGSAGNYIFTAKAISGKFPATKIEIKLDGQIIGTKDVNGDATYSMPYAVTQSGNHTITSTVIDAGLYSDDSQDETVTGGASTSSGPKNFLSNNNATTTSGSSSDRPRRNRFR